MGLGSMTDQRAQTLRDAEIQRWNINQSRDAEALARYAGISQGLGALGGSQLSTTTKPAPSLFQQMLGFGGAGLSLLK
jgi:ferric-dicitrate binding protein FerR (iron transport regulator)